ncbi:hypothetical protein GGX14DRAFT_691979 [Mycena pura]|uniref:Uncharacterized protein n=1 Tax=Mycena pura TaxID=153505 RepID=A0AAD6YUG8_9AGAR|nr:hypothetical protein GGX14DRAFT_691979 [Mycena pura]
MPRATVTPNRRTNREPRPLARTAASVRAAALAASTNTQGSISAPFKLETVPVPIPAPASVRSSPSRDWRHPDELPYIKSPGKTWNDMAIVRFLTAHAFSVPPRSTNRHDPWVTVRRADGIDFVLPRPYRIPLMWVAKFQWSSMQIVLTAEERQREWDETKFELLHIARLCATLLDKARAHFDEVGAIDRGWRCPTFDRALRRYWHKWLIMGKKNEMVCLFFDEFGEEEYANDVLELPWGRWVLKGHKGFLLTSEEIANGITKEVFMEGLVINEATNSFEWRASEAHAAMEEDVQNIVLESESVSKATLSEEPSPSPATENGEIIQNNVKPKPYVRIPFPFELRRVRMLSTPATVEAKTPADTCTTDQESSAGAGTQTAEVLPGKPSLITRASAVGAASTRMGSLAPGSRILRELVSPVSAQTDSHGSQTDAEVQGAGNLSPADGSEDSSEGRDDDDDKEMPDVQENHESPMDGSSSGVQTVEMAIDDPDLDDGLQLLYPGSPEHRWPPPSPSQRGSMSGESSILYTPASRSPSSVPPPLSIARFPSLSVSTVSTPGAPVIPAPASHTSAFPSAPPVDPALSARFMQLCDELGAEVRTLRAEVGQLRAELAASATVLESPKTNGSWAHPLQHLVSARDAEMTVETDVAAPAAGRRGLGGTHSRGHGGATDTSEHEPLPPRSRKFKI